jgi:hypothetical protein
MTFWSILSIVGYIELVLFVLLLLCAPYMLWCDFAGVMNLKRVRDKARAGTGKAMTRWELGLGTYLLLRGTLLDIFVNMVHTSIYLLEWPREALVTSRINRHVATGSGWRYERCLAARVQLLNNLDPRGTHT